MKTTHYLLFCLSESHIEHVIAQFSCSAQIAMESATRKSSRIVPRHGETLQQKLHRDCHHSEPAERFISGYDVLVVFIIDIDAVRDLHCSRNDVASRKAIAVRWKSPP